MRELLQLVGVAGAVVGAVVAAVAPHAAGGAGMLCAAGLGAIVGSLWPPSNGIVIRRRSR